MRFSGVGTTGTLEAAATAAGRSGDASLQGETLFRMGVVTHIRSEYDTAQTRYEEALALYQRIREPYSIGLTHRRLARIARSEAERHQHAAWTSIGRPDLVDQLTGEFGHN